MTAPQLEHFSGTRGISIVDSTHFTADVFSVDKPTMTYYVSNNPANGYKYIDTDISHYVSIQETSSASAHRFIHHHGYIAGDKYRESDLSY
jgi:hypothetical protein